ncbi:dihydrofolate reductase family protein [Mycolicibacterium pulveris]|uniref:Deaminase n=1 Tax=Mycolicibacterium pulveris TaxID=36813 RepID=A0A7I7UPK7_MYCPV|nr:dihydrofolate reductase family protein [Mycolicibacterium pulveris]MCV6983513.1 dihydrofolate reductase family protein [Mycolicibacterium pulveris]BBY83392.1 deaminase [Mycolicibacterium pulveris]
MRKLIYSMTASLDGYISAPRGEHDGWAVPDEELHRFHNDAVRGLGGHLLGRRLYEVMTYWEGFEEREPDAPQYAHEFARIWQKLPKIVYSTTLTEVEGNTTLSTADPVTEVTRLKQEPGEPLAVGGADLAATLIRHDLIDEYRVFLAPTALGGGKPYFTALDRQIALELQEARTFDTGVVYLRYAAR